MSDITDQDRMDALVLLAETRLERIEKQQAEINRLQKMNSALLSAKNVEIVPPPIPEGFVIQELQKAIVALHADIARLRSGVRCPHCDELRLELGRAQREIAQMSGLLAEVGTQHRTLAGLFRGAQVPAGANAALDSIERCVREALGEWC